MSDEPLPVVVAPATVIAPETGTKEELDAASRRHIAERSAPNTTEEQDRASAGQRVVNLTWEKTQRLIALAVTAVSLMVSAWLAIMGATESVQTAALVFVFGVANLVIGFYFGRTNHTRSSGHGPDTTR